MNDRTRSLHPRIKFRADAKFYTDPLHADKSLISRRTAVRRFRANEGSIILQERAD